MSINRLSSLELSRLIKRLQNQQNRFMAGNGPPLSGMNYNRLVRAMRRYENFYWAPGGLGYMKMLLRNSSFRRATPKRRRSASVHRSPKTNKSARSA